MIFENLTLYSLHLEVTTLHFTIFWNHYIGNRMILKHYYLCGVGLYNFNFDGFALLIANEG